MRTAAVYVAPANAVKGNACELSPGASVTASRKDQSHVRSGAPGAIWPSRSRFGPSQPAPLATVARERAHTANTPAPRMATGRVRPDGAVTRKRPRGAGSDV